MIEMDPKWITPTKFERTKEKKVLKEQVWPHMIMQHYNLYQLNEIQILREVRNILVPMSFLKFLCLVFN